MIILGCCFWCISASVFQPGTQLSVKTADSVTVLYISPTLKAATLNPRGPFTYPSGTSLWALWRHTSHLPAFPGAGWSCLQRVVGSGFETQIWILAVALTQASANSVKSQIVNIYSFADYEDCCKCLESAACITEGAKDCNEWISVTGFQPNLIHGNVNFISFTSVKKCSILFQIVSQPFENNKNEKNYSQFTNQVKGPTLMTSIFIKHVTLGI